MGVQVKFFQMEMLFTGCFGASQSIGHVSGVEGVEEGRYFGARRSRITNVGEADLRSCHQFSASVFSQFDGLFSKHSTLAFCICQFLNIFKYLYP